jgi:hypothetical protein
VQAFAVVHPIVELEDTIIIEFIDETEPEETRRYRLFLEKKTRQEIKLIVFRPKLDSWQDITSMISPFYLASLKNVLMEQEIRLFENSRDVIS